MFQRKITSSFFVLSLFLAFFVLMPASNALECKETNQTCRAFDPYTGECTRAEKKIGLCEGADSGKNCCEKQPTLSCNKTGQKCRTIGPYGVSCIGPIEKKIGLCGTNDESDCCEKIATVDCTGQGESCQGKGTYGYCDSGDTEVGLCSDGKMCCKKAPSSTAPPTSASLTYTPLEAIPGQGTTQSDFPAYVKALYAFAIFSVAIAALLMVMIGGFIYVTAAGNTSQVDKGKEFIKDALIGIVVAFGSYLILYVINPNLVNINLDSLRKLTMTSGGATWGPSPTPTPPGEPMKTGDCSGYILSGPTCSLLSSEIQAFLKCLRSAVPSEIPITLKSLTSNASGNSLEKSASCCGHGGNPGGGCPHWNNSCHHGCTTSNKGYSYAVDISMTAGDKNYCTIATAAKNCNAIEALGPATSCGVKAAKGHETHFHFSAGCNSSLP